MIYKLFSPPYSPLKNNYFFSLFFLFSKDLHPLYKLLKEVSNLEKKERQEFFWELSPKGKGIKKFKDLIRKIEIQEWEGIKRILQNKKPKIEKKVNKISEKIKEVIKEALLIEKFPEEFYIFLSYKPTGIGGSALFLRYPAILLITNERNTTEEEINEFLHEFIHFLFTKEGYTKIFREVIGQEYNKF